MRFLVKLLPVHYCNIRGQFEPTLFSEKIFLSQFLKSGQKTSLDDGENDPQDNWKVVSGSTTLPSGHLNPSPISNCPTKAHFPITKIKLVLEAARVKIGSPRSEAIFSAGVWPRDFKFGIRTLRSPLQKVNFISHFDSTSLNVGFLTISECRYFCWTPGTART